MSILKQENQKPSKEERIKMIAQRIRRFTANSYQQLESIQNQGINMVWENPNGDISAQETINELGEDAIAIFSFHHKLTNFIAEIAQDDGVTPKIKFPTNNFEITQEGIIVKEGEPFDPNG